MAVRINKAKNFRNKAYVAVDELDSLMQSVTFAYTGGEIARAEGNHADDWILTFTTADGNVEHTSFVDLTGIKDYIDNKSIKVTGGNGIAIVTSNASGAGSLLNPTINADVDGTTIILTGATEGSKKIAANLTLKKKGTANTGYAATYYLAYGDSTTPIGTEIDIVKDNLVKEGTLVYNASATPTYGENGLMTGESATKIDNGYAFVKLTLNTNTNGDATDNETVTYLYIPVSDLFHDKTAGNGIDSAALTSNVIQVVVDGTNQIHVNGTTSGSILTVDSTGIHIADIQGAINYAVKNEHEKVVSVVTALNGNISSVANTTSTAVTALNTRVETVATNAAAAVNSAVVDIKAIDSKVDAAIDDVNLKVESAVDAIVTNVNSAVGTTVTNVNTAVSGAIDTVNTKVNGAVSNVNTQVTALKDTVSSSIDDVNTKVTAFKNTVFSSIDNAQTAVSNFRNATSSAMTQAIDNRSTQLTNAVQVLEETVTVEAELGNTGNYGATVTAVHILAVFDNDGNEIYPDIHRGSTTSLDPQASPTYYYSVTADYGTETTPSEDERTWTIVYTMPLPALGATTMPAYTAGSNTVAYTNATNSVSYDNAGNGTDASYSNASAATATAVDADDAEYATSEITNKSVANGTSATAPTAPTGATKEAPDYAGYPNA